MKLKKILSIILVALMLTATMAVGAGAADEATLEELMLPQVVKDTQAWAKSSTPKYENLYGLRVNLLGDSYLAGHTLENADRLVWPALLAHKYGWELTNCAQNGAPVSTETGITYAESMVDNINKMPYNSPDLVIFDGGRNDYNKNVPLGEVDSRNTATFMGALNVVIDGLERKYPNATLIFTTVWNFSGTNSIGLTAESYAMAASKVCEARGVYVFLACMPGISGVDMSSSEFRAQYCLTPTDVSHLNVEGMKLVMPIYERYISETYAKANPEPDEPEAETGDGNESNGGNGQSTETDTGKNNNPPTVPNTPSDDKTFEMIIKIVGLASFVAAGLVILIVILISRIKKKRS